MFDWFLLDTNNRPGEILEAMVRPESLAAVDMVCPEEPEPEEHAMEAAMPPPRHTSQARTVRPGKRKTLDAAVDLLAARTNTDQQQLALDELKLKLEEEKLRLQRDRYENIELVQMQMQLEDQRDRALERQQRNEQHAAAIERCCCTYSS